MSQQHRGRVWDRVLTRVSNHVRWERVLELQVMPQLLNYVRSVPATPPHQGGGGGGGGGNGGGGAAAAGRQSVGGGGGGEVGSVAVEAGGRRAQLDKLQVELDWGTLAVYMCKRGCWDAPMDAALRDSPAEAAVASEASGPPHMVGPGDVRHVVEYCWRQPGPDADVPALSCPHGTRPPTPQWPPARR